MPTNGSFSDEYYASQPAKPPHGGSSSQSPSSHNRRSLSSNRYHVPPKNRGPRAGAGRALVIFFLVIVCAAGGGYAYLKVHLHEHLVVYLSKDPSVISASARTPEGTAAEVAPALADTTNQLVNADGPAQPQVGAAALAVLNQQRAANGIPRLRELQQVYASAWCPNEDGGARGGETDRDLSGLVLWDATLSPWDNAPNHQLSMYDPLFTAAGDVDVSAQACLGLGAPTEGGRPRFYAYTADGGHEHVPPTENVHSEVPFAPQQYVGIAQGVTTGPQLLLYAEGFPGELLNVRGTAYAVHPRSWTLTDLATGARVRNLKMFDSEVAARTAFSYGYNDDAVLIPPPLRPHTRYRVRVRWQGASGVAATQEFTFMTERASAFTLSGNGTSSLVVSTQSPGKVYFVLTKGARGPDVATAAFKAGASREFTLDSGAGSSYGFCFYQPQEGGYTAGTACTAFIYSGNARVHLTVSVR